MAKLIVVYNRDGKAEKHTLPNARDLVNGAEYTWKPGVEANPVNFAPAHVVPTREEKQKMAAKPASQEIFDRYGTTATEEDDPLNHAAQMDTILDETSPPVEADPVPVVTAATVEPTPVVTPVVEDTADADTSDAAPVEQPLTELPRRGRPPRNKE